MNTIADRPLAPAKFIGTQHCAGLMPDFELWNLTAPVVIDGKLYAAGSSLNREALEAAGFTVPPAFTPEQEARRAAWYGRPESMGTRHPFQS
jgi:hypothetical protein